MKKEITGLDISYNVRYGILNLFTRDDLRIMARKYGLRRGRNKDETARIIAAYPEKVKIRIEVE